MINFLDKTGVATIWNKIKIYVESVISGLVKNGENSKEVQITDTDSESKTKSEVALSSESTEISFSAEDETGIVKNYLIINSEGAFYNGTTSDDEIVTSKQLNNKLKVTYNAETKTLSLENLEIE